MQKDDVIYRQAAILALGEEPEVWMDDDDYTLGQRNQWRYDVAALKAVPPAQPERKEGRWIQDESGDYKCSECGGREDLFIYGTEDWYGNGESNYCPHCGADMRGEQDETNVIT